MRIDNIIIIIFSAIVIIGLCFTAKAHAGLTVGILDTFILVFIPLFTFFLIRRDKINVLAFVAIAVLIGLSVFLHIRYHIQVFALNQIKLVGILIILLGIFTVVSLLMNKNLPRK
jgi:hypothetical protein